MSLRSVRGYDRTNNLTIKPMQMNEVERMKLWMWSIVRNIQKYNINLSFKGYRRERLLNTHTPFCLFITLRVMIWPLSFLWENHYIVSFIQRSRLSRLTWY